MPLQTSTASSIASGGQQPRRRCWTVCESSRHRTSSKKCTDLGAGIAAIDRCRRNSLRISLGEGDEDVRQSAQLLLPCSSPSFSFDSINNMFAVMNSATGSMTPTVSRGSNPCLGYDDEATRLHATISPAANKRQKKSISSHTSAARTSSRQCTSILSRCLPRQKVKSTNPNERDDSTLLESHEYSHRTTETGSMVSPSSCSALAGRGSGVTGRRRFGTVLLNDDNQDLHLFREEAEYSDYLSAFITGAHSEMDSVVFYELEVHLSQMTWKLYRRFSEFRALRQELLKHFSKRLRQQQNAAGCDKCEICTNLLQTIESTAFPSRQQTHRHWGKLFGTTASSSSPSSSSGETGPLSRYDVIADRKAKFAEFVSVCLLTMRGLRQHGKVMKDSSACEISVALRMIEEFLGLSFTRYLRFLSERGVVSGSKNASSDGKAAASSATSRRFTVAS
ncbi:Phox homologous domain, partial [Globisporangium splendens]